MGGGFAETGVIDTDGCGGLNGGLMDTAEDGRDVLGEFIGTDIDGAEDATGLTVTEELRCLGSGG